MAAKNSNEVAEGMGIDMAPRIHLTVDDLPDIKNWDVGETYTVSMKLKQTSLQEGGWDGKQPLSADFRIVSVNGKSPKKKDMEYEEDED
jgi:hypothetical protein